MRNVNWSRIVAAIFIVLVTSLIVLGSSLNREETIIIAFEGGPAPAPGTANPFSLTAYYNQGLIQMCMESLFYLNVENGELIPWLAKGFEYNDSCTEVTLYLRRGVYWSDGWPFTADDVVFTIELLQDYGEALWRGDIIRDLVRKVYKIDDYTVRMELTRPYPRFILEEFSVHIGDAIVIVPQHIWQDQDPTSFSNFDLEIGWPVFTGPYQLVECTPERFVYTRRDDWWAIRAGVHNPPAAKNLVFIAQPNEATRAAMIAAGEVDALPQLTLESFERVHAQNPDVIAWSEGPPYGWYAPCPMYLDINTTAPPWDDPEMRWALSYAIDKELFAELTFPGGGGIATPFIMPDYPVLQALVEENGDLFETFPVLAFSPAKAGEIFDQHGYLQSESGWRLGPDGEPLTVEILLVEPGHDDFWRLAGPVLQSMLEAIGVRAEIIARSFAAMKSDSAAGLFECRVGWACGSLTDPFRSLDNFHSRYITEIGEHATHNYGRWANEAYDAVVDEIGGLQPGDERIGALFREALSIWLKDLPCVPLCQHFRIYPLNTTYWTNWPTSENDYFSPVINWMSLHQILINLEPVEVDP